MKHQQLIQRLFFLLITGLTVSYVGTVFAGVPPSTFSFTFNTDEVVINSSGNDNYIPNNYGGNGYTSNATYTGGTDGQTIIKYRVKVKEATTVTSITNSANITIYYGQYYDQSAGGLSTTPLSKGSQPAQRLRSINPLQPISSPLKPLVQDR